MVFDQKFTSLKLIVCNSFFLRDWLMDIPCLIRVSCDTSLQYIELRLCRLFVQVQANSPLTVDPNNIIEVSNNKVAVNLSLDVFFDT